MGQENKFEKIKNHLDEGIKEAVRILIDNGIETFESCEGGKGHAFPEPTIRFEGDMFDCIRVLDICDKNNLNAHVSRYCFNRIDGILEKPFCEVIFLHHKETGTIYLPY